MIMIVSEKKKEITESLVLVAETSRSKKWWREGLEWPPPSQRMRLPALDVVLPWPVVGRVIGPGAVLRQVLVASLAARILTTG